MQLDEALLLKAICDHPEDDLPRAVYLDWLEERGRSEEAERIKLESQATESVHRNYLHASGKIIRYDSRNNEAAPVIYPDRGDYAFMTGSTQGFVSLLVCEPRSFEHIAPLFTFQPIAIVFSTDRYLDSYFRSNRIENPIHQRLEIHVMARKDAPRWMHAETYMIPITAADRAMHSNSSRYVDQLELFISRRIYQELPAIYRGLAFKHLQKERERIIRQLENGTTDFLLWNEHEQNQISILEQDRQMFWLHQSEHGWPSRERGIPFGSRRTD